MLALCYAGIKTEKQTATAGIEIEEERRPKPKAAIPWPKDLPSQIAAVPDLITGKSSWLSTEIPGFAQALSWPWGDGFTRSTRRGGEKRSASSAFSA